MVVPVSAAHHFGAVDDRMEVRLTSSDLVQESELPGEFLVALVFSGAGQSGCVVAG